MAFAKVIHAWFFKSAPQSNRGMMPVYICLIGGIVCLFQGCRNKPQLAPAEPINNQPTVIHAGDTLSIRQALNFPQTGTISINGAIPLASTLERMKMEFGRPDSIGKAINPCFKGRQGRFKTCYFGLSEFMLEQDSLYFHAADLTGIRIFLKQGSFIFNKETTLSAVSKYFGFKDTLQPDEILELAHQDYPYRWLMRFENQRLQTMAINYQCSSGVNRKK